jgi:hypothetical protein
MWCMVDTLLFRVSGSKNGVGASYIRSVPRRDLRLSAGCGACVCRRAELRSTYTLLLRKFATTRTEPRSERSTATAAHTHMRMRAPNTVRYPCHLQRWQSGPSRVTSETRPCDTIVTFVFMCDSDIPLSIMTMHSTVSQVSLPLSASASSALQHAFQVRALAQKFWEPGPALKA